MARSSKSHASTPRAATPRARITAARRALEAGEALDLRAVHEAFEALRDATEQPARLFALAVEEARLLDQAARSAKHRALANAALVPALVRILGGVASGIRAQDLVWAAERLESALRGAPGRALNDAAYAHALAALTLGYERAGELARARRSAARWVQRVERTGPPAEIDLALSRMFELALAAGDVAAALKAARARAAHLHARGEDVDPADLADALAPVAHLEIEAGEASTAFVTARAWLAAERAAQVQGAMTRGTRVIDALATIARAARAAGNTEAWQQATLDWAMHALLADARDSHSAARKAEALAALTDLHAERGDHDAALATAHDWVAAECAAGGARSSGTAAALGALMSVAAQMGEWVRCAAAADEYLRAFGARSEGGAAALAFSARARFALGDHEEAGRAAQRWLAMLAKGEGVDESSDAAEMVSIAAQCAEAALRLRKGSARARAATAVLKRAKATLDALDALPHARHHQASRAAALAAVALAEHAKGSHALARRHANAAIERLEAAVEVTRAASAFVTYVHEFLSGTSPATRERDTQESENVLAISARALAAAEAGDRARAMQHLAVLEHADLDEAPDALAHTLAATARLLQGLASGDAALNPGRQAWREAAPFALLAAAIPNFSRFAPDKG